MLQAIELVRRFGNRTLLEIERFSLAPGECVQLIGANGSGKTTLMKLLAGLDRPCHGRIWLNEPPTLLGCPWLARLFGHLHLRGQVLYLHQRPYLFDSSVQANIAFALHSLPLPVTEKRRRLKQALSAADLESLALQPARTLSGGEQQRLALARAWVRAPRWLLLDEPGSNMDVASVTRLTGLVAQLQNKGCGILLSSHQHNDFTQLCGRTVRLEQGRLL